MTEEAKKVNLGMGGMSTRTAARSAWALVVLSFALTVSSLWLLVVNLSHPDVHVYDYWVETTLAAMGFSAVGAVITSRIPPNNPIGWLFCIEGLLAAATHFTGEYAIYTLLAAPGSPLPAGEAAAWVTSWLWVPQLGSIVFVVLLFPDGRLPSRSWRPFAWLCVLSVLIGAVLGAVSPGPIIGLGSIHNPLAVESLPNAHKPIQMVMVVLLAVAAGSILIRWIHARGVERQQIKWFLYTTALAASGAILQYAIAAPLELVLLGWVGRALVLAGLAGIPISMGIAITRYRLYEIDLVINRTLVYGSLTACIVGFYVLAVGGLGALFQTQGNLGVSLLATGVVAVLFQPLRGRLQRGVNRLMYGERDDPYAVLSRLGRGLEEALAPEAVLSTVVETIAQALKLPYAAILLKESDGFETAAAHGSPAGEPEVLPLVYGREETGRLVLSPRAPGEGFSDADRRLLEDFARHAEVAVHAVRLTADLQRSREQLVSAREEERRRLRRDLHDGLGPTLASLALKLDAARKLVRRRPGDAEELLTNLKEQTQETVIDVRRLVYGLRPPALDDLGLIPALRQQAGNQGFSERAEGHGVGFSIEAPEELSSLPAAVEVAAYRIAQEALTNVARHARAGSCHVRLSVDAAGGTMDLEIRDDGVGMPEGRRAGIGLSSMRERAEELGGTCDVGLAPDGGTRVLARLPLNASKNTYEGAPSWATPSASS